MILSIGDWEILPFTFHYDELDRLNSVVFNGMQLELFGYDANGNIDSALHLQKGSLSYAYQPGTNRVESVAGWRNTAFVYDAHGNMIADTAKGTTYSYDAFNQLDTVSLATMFDSTPYIAFGYAPSGERVYKKYYYWFKASCGGVTMALGDPMTTTGVGGPGGGISIDSCLFADTSKLYYVIGNGMTLAEYENPKYANSLKAKYIYAGEKRIAMVDNTGQVFYYLNDHLGSTRAVVSKVEDACILKDRYVYNSYGSDWVVETATNQAYKYTGKPFDDDGGFDLYCYGARYYDPDLGRFISVDPFERTNPAWSPYVFCANNPLRFIDPTGLEWYEIVEEYQVTEEYFDADGFLQTRVVTKQRKVWQWFPDTPYMDVWTGEYDAEGNKVMQTVEGLSDNQLLLAMFLEEAMRAFGIEDAISVAVMVFGQEWVSKAFQWAGATRGTSPLAIALRKIAPYHIMPNWAKAPVGWPKVLGGNGMKMASGKGVGAFAARWLPVGSAVLLAISTGQTFYYTFDHYNEVLESR